MISYVSIVLGELTAKRLALQRAESVALALAPLVDFIARIARPVIWLLGVVHQRRRPDSRRRPEGSPRGGDRRGDPRHGQRLDHARRRGAADRGRRLRRRRAQPARGDAAADRGRLPARRHAGAPGRPRVDQGAALALSGDGGVGRRHHRLRPRPRPARSRHQLPDDAGVRGGPAGAVDAGHRAGAAGAERHAAQRRRTWRSCWTSTAARPAS